MRGQQEAARLSAGRGLTRRALFSTLVAGAATIGGSALASTDIRPLVTRCRFGAWAHAGAGLVQDHRDLEVLLRVRLPVFSWFKDWGAGWDAGIARQISGLADDLVYDCQIGWEAWGVPFAEIVDGSRDRFLVSFFDGAKAFPGRVILRLFHEMNGNWYPWSSAAVPALVAGTDQWRLAWRRIVQVARDRNAGNVRFMFCVNADDVGGVPVESYWPGAGWVDVLGIDGYNWGWHPDGTPWTGAEQVIEPMYRRLTALHQSAPVMVGEIGCAENENKHSWYQGLYTSTKFPRLERISFFNEKKEQDWRIESDRRSLELSRSYLRSAPAALAASSRSQPER